MRKGKKLVCLAAGMLLACVFLVTGCGPRRPETEAKITFDPEKEVTIRLAISNDPNEKTIAESFARAYEAKYPKKKVAVETMPGDYVNSLIFDYNAGILQDMMWMGDDQVAGLTELGVLMNLSDFMKIEKEQNAENAFDESLYYESMMKMGRKGQSGDYYMFPRDYNKNVIFYNKALLNQIGAEAPANNNWTWDDFMDYTKMVGEKLTAKQMTLDKGYEALEGANLDWKAIVYPMLKSYGGKFLDETGKPCFKTEAMEKTLTNIGAFANKGYSQPIGQTGARGSFMAGKAAMYIGSRPSVGTAILRKIDFGVVGYPQTGTKENGVYTNPLIGSGTTGYGINNTTEYPEDCWNFLKFILSEEGQEAFSETGSCVPVLKSMAEDQDATWRKYPEIPNTDAFVLYPERDCTIDIFLTANPKNEQILLGNYAGMIMDVTTGTRGVKEAIDFYYEEIMTSMK